MSQENVDALQEQFDATSEGDFARAMTFWAEDVVLFVDPNAFLDAGTFEGREAVGKWFADWLTTFEPGYRFELEQVQDLGDAVLFVASHQGRGKSSGIEVHGKTGYLYTFRDGKIIRAELYRDREAALAAAGLKE
jgi:ketosteroid isomerase-like protein